MIYICKIFTKLHNITFVITFVKQTHFYKSTIKLCKYAFKVNCRLKFAYMNTIKVMI